MNQIKPIQLVPVQSVERDRISRRVERVGERKVSTNELYHLHNIATLSVVSTRVVVGFPFPVLMNPMDRRGNDRKETTIHNGNGKN